MGLIADEFRTQYGVYITPEIEDALEVAAIALGHTKGGLLDRIRAAMKAPQSQPRSTIHVIRMWMAKQPRSVNLQ